MLDIDEIKERVYEMFEEHCDTEYPNLKDIAKVVDAESHTEDVLIGLDGQMYRVEKVDESCACGVPKKGSFGVVKPEKDAKFDFLTDLDDHESKSENAICNLIYEVT